jgi:hypothetical protein
VAEERIGLAIDEGASTCVSVPDDIAVLQIPVEIASQETFGIAITHLELLSPENIEVVGFLLVAGDSRTYSRDFLPSSELLDDLRERGQDVQPVQELEEGEVSKLTVLLEVSGRNAVASAAGVRIEWISGEPVYYQDTARSLRLDDECTLSEAPQASKG